MNSDRENAELAIQVNRELLRQKQVLALAESCTAGLIAATLAEVAGASRVLAGSAVVYQIPTKTTWLKLDADLITQADVVSAEVAQAMADRVLQQTPHATIALGITGHLGPDAPPRLDGVVWSAIVSRDGDSRVRQLDLDSELSRTDDDARHLSLRVRRQRAAVCSALRFLIEFLN